MLVKSLSIGFGTDRLLATVGPLSWLNMAEMDCSLSLFLATQLVEPNRTNSSPAQRQTRIERLGLPPAFMINLAASIADATPAALSAAPVGETLRETTRLINLVDKIKPEVLGTF